MSPLNCLFKRSFNPCFDGSVARGELHGNRVRRAGAVSILVLMEV